MRNSIQTVVTLRAHAMRLVTRLICYFFTNQIFCHGVSGGAVISTVTSRQEGLEFRLIIVKFACSLNQFYP